VMGSSSDLPVMQGAVDVLDEFDVTHEVRVVSAHRTPRDMLAFGQEAAGRGLRVLIAGAGGAAHLPGMLASVTTLPVIGVPVALSQLDGLDSLLSIVQMPKGVPVATMAVNGARNAGLLAVRILAQADPVTCGSVVIDRISRLTPDISDPAGMHLIGVAANAVWAHDVGLAFLTVAVDGLRGQGRLRLLAQALSAQAWAAVHQAREPLAVSAAEEGMALARETGQIEWIVAAQLAKAAIAAERGDLRVVDVLTSEAEALIG